MSDSVRIDSFLWAVRIFKTRTISGDACKKNRVSVNGSPVKPSRLIHIGDTISVRKPPITLTYRVLKIAKQRMGAKLVPEYIDNITPASEYEVLELQKISGFIDRAKGTGRPTKRERRKLESFVEQMSENDSFFSADESFFDFDDEEDILDTLDDDFFDFDDED